MQESNRLSNKNWIPVWFKLYKKLGQSTSTHILKVNHFDNSYTNLTVDHEESDGFGYALDLYAKDDWKIDLNQFKTRELPSKWTRFISILKYPLWSRIRQVKWKHFDLRNQKELGPYFHHFSKEESQKILNFCKIKQTDLNSYLLWRANQTANQLLTENSDELGIWWIPVDMRKFVPMSGVKENLSSHIAVEIGASDSAKIIKNKLTKKLKNYDFLGAWWWLQIGNFIGEKGMEIILSNQIKKNKWTGTYTNMGAWPRPGFTPPDNFTYAIFGTPPAPVGHPLSLGVAVFYKEIYVAATINNCIVNDELEAQNYFNQWVKNILDHSETESSPAP